MTVKESKKLQLIFKNSQGGQNTISPKHFREDVTETELRTWMDNFVGLNLFRNIDKQVDLYIEKQAARIVETRITDLFDMDEPAEAE